MKHISVYDPTAKDAQSRVRGIGRYYQTLREALDTLDHMEPSNKADSSNVAAVSPFQTTSSNPADNLLIQYTSDIKNIKKEDIAVNPFFSPIQKPVSVHKVGSKRIAVIHDIIPLKYPKRFPLGLRGKWYEFLCNRAKNKYDVIITDSEASKQDLINIYKIPQNNIKVIYPTVPRMFLPHVDSHSAHHPFHTDEEGIKPEFTPLDFAKMSSNKNLTNLNDFVIYVGDATWNKNLPALAQAVKLANVNCVCVGKVFEPKQGQTKPHPWHTSLLQFLKMVEGDKRFIFPGFVSDIELLTLYKRAKTNLLLSHDEGFGLSFIEAGFMSTPSILSDIPVFREIAGNAADFVGGNNPKDIAQKIVEHYYDSVRQEKMSIMAFDRAQDYHPKRFQQKWVEVLTFI
ncbi:MAG: glycosyltransferase family 1 protein [bacterium]|nr:glycosyltransferase family 1 protein [bacterium]